MPDQLCQRARRSSAYFDDAHHAFVFVIDRVTMVDKASDDYRVSEGDDDLEHAWSLLRGWSYRECVAQTVIVPSDAADCGHPEVKSLPTAARHQRVRSASTDYT